MGLELESRNCSKVQPAKSEIAGNDLYAFPLSPAQQRIWREDRKAPGNSAYNAAFRWRLDGLVDPAILEQGFNEIVRRHEILRATFVEVRGSPQQIIAPSLQLKLGVTDLGNLPESKREAEMDRLCTEEARHGFELEKGPLIRVQLLRMSERKHILTLSLHHIICDGWSIRVIMEELRQIYPAFLKGMQSQLPKMSIQYPDYVVWQLERSEDESLRNQLAHWTKKLQDYRRLEVESDFPRPDKSTIDSAILSVLLPRELTDKLKDFSDQLGGTMFSTALAACMLLLHRHTGRSDISVGSPSAGRDQPEIEGLVGVFMNDVVYRAEIKDDLLLADFFSAVRDMVWEAVANQDAPFDRVISELRAGGQEPPEPFFAINFICQRAFGGLSSLKFESVELQAVPIPSKSQGALFDLNFFMIEREEGWRLSLEYNSSLYREATAQRLIDDYCHLLHQVPESQGRRVSELVFSGESSSLNLEAAHSNSDGGLPEDELYSMPATVAQERFWSFAKLDSSNSAFNMPAAVRLKGPLSIGALEASLQFVMERHEILRTTFKENNGSLIQVIARELDVSKTVSAVAPEPRADRDSRLAELVRKEAHVPFDLERGPLIRAHIFRLDDQDHVLLVTVHHIISDGWSQSVFQREMWSAYEAIVENRPHQSEPLQIQYGDFAVWQKEWLASKEASVQRKFWMTRLSGDLPTVDFPTDRPPMHRLARGDLESHLLPDGLVREMKDLCKAEGATAFMVTLSCFAVLLSLSGKQEDLLVGSPVANRRRETEPLIGPFAVPIALRLDLSGNPSLREVLRRTREVTIDGLSHADYPFELLARDLKVRSVQGRNPLFQFYFLYQTAFLQGRSVAGLEISPWHFGSVGTPFEMQMAIIERSDGVCVNLDYNSDLFDRSTVRQVLEYFEYLLRKFIADPDCRIENVNKPIYRAADQTRQRPRDERPTFVAPRNEYETLIAEIWQDVFGLPKVGIHDDFFALGGNSLRAAEFVLKLERHSGIVVDLSTIIVRPTIRELAEKIRLEEADSLVVPLRQARSRLPLFCIHPGGGHLFHYLDLIKALPSDQTVYGLRPPDVDNLRHVLSVERLAKTYIAEIQRVQPDGPYQLCGMSFGGQIACEMGSQLIEQGESVNLVALFDTSNRTSRSSAPLSSAVVCWKGYLHHLYRKYVVKLASGGLGEVASSIGASIRTRRRITVWRTVRRICRLFGWPVPSRMHNMLDTFEALSRSYRPKPFAGELVLFWAKERGAQASEDVTLGWGEIAQRGVKVHYVPGNHITMMRPPNVSSLAKQLSDYLAPRAGKTK